MNVNPLASNLVNLLTPEPVTTRPVELGDDLTQGSGTGMEFANVFAEAFNTAAEANAADRATTVELLTGETDDLVRVMIDIQKAELSLNLAIQIRNRVVDAYNEIMRMQV